MDDIILETKRLQLRYQRDEDFDFIIKLWTDEKITRYVGGPRNENILIKSIKNVALNPRKEKYDLWYVVIKNTNKLIGMAGLLPKEIDNEQFYEINYYIEEKQWNKGFATEIANELIQYFLEKKGIQTFIAIIDKENIASIKVARKIGMKYWKTEMRNSGEKEIYKVEYL